MKYLVIFLIVFLAIAGILAIVYITKTECVKNCSDKPCTVTCSKCNTGYGVDWDMTPDSNGTCPLNPRLKNVSLFGIQNVSTGTFYVAPAYVYPTDGSAQPIPSHGTFQGDYPSDVKSFLDGQYSNVVGNFQWYYDDNGDDVTQHKYFHIIKLPDGMYCAPTTNPPPYVENGNAIAIVIKDSFKPAN